MNVFTLSLVGFTWRGHALDQVFDEPPELCVIVDQLDCAGRQSMLAFLAEEHGQFSW